MRYYPNSAMHFVLEFSPQNQFIPNFPFYNMKILLALLPILAALIAGYAIGKILPKQINDKLIRYITPLVWLMLFLIGCEFGEIIFSADAIGKVIKNALIFSLLTTGVSVVLLWVLKETKLGTNSATDTKNTNNTNNTRKKLDWKTALPALKEAGIALSMVFFGALFFILQTKLAITIPLLKSSDLLLLLIVLVGVDFTQVTLDKSWFSRSILMVPLLVIIGSLLSAFLSAWLSGESLSVSMALSSGFGWFTLSSVLIGEAYGHQYGSMALLTDLFRELIAIVILYVMGAHRPKVSIGSAGATAVGSTLPFVKQICPAENIPMALVSGFLLTSLAPFFITIFLP